MTHNERSMYAMMALQFNAIIYVHEDSYEADAWHGPLLRDAFYSILDYSNHFIPIEWSVKHDDWIQKPEVDTKIIPLSSLMSAAQ